MGEGNGLCGWLTPRQPSCHKVRLGWLEEKAVAEAEAECWYYQCQRQRSQRQLTQGSFNHVAKSTRDPTGRQGATETGEAVARLDRFNRLQR